MGAPTESLSQYETHKNYEFELVENTNRASGSMGLVEIKKAEIKVKDGDETVGVIPIEGWVTKRDLGKSEATRASYDNELIILKHLATHKTKAAPEVRVGENEISTEYIRGVPGVLINYGDNVYTAAEVAKVLLRSQIELINNGVAFLDVKPANYKLTVDSMGRPRLARFFDFGNASLIEGGYIKTGIEHLVRGFPPEVLAQAKEKVGGPPPTFLERAVKKLSSPQPIIANRAVIYATGMHFKTILEEARFNRGTNLKDSREYQELMAVTAAMTAEEAKRRISLKDAWETINGIAQPAKAGSCVKEEIRQGLIRTGEIPLNWKEYATEEQIQEVLAKGPTRKS